MNKSVAERNATDVDKLETKEVSVARPRGGFSFRYAYREVSLSGGQTRLRSREHRFEDGEFRSEELDAPMDGAVYHEAVKATHDLVANQVSALVNLFSAFLPSSRSK